MDTDLGQDGLAWLGVGFEARRRGSRSRSHGEATDAAALKKIERALLRIESGEYGYCADCGDPLPLVVLEQNPTTESCGCRD